MPVRCHHFTADFDVRASISSSVPAGADRITPDASTSQGDEVVCEKANIYSLKPKHTESVGPGSATHQTNHWSFAAQTSVVVAMSHQEIANALGIDPALPKLPKEP
jgi:hypothetical protein